MQGQFMIPAASVMAHKYQRGHCFVVSGPAHATGAARLAARSALRAGAGLVTVLGDAQALPVLAATLTAVMVRDAGDPASISAALADRRTGSVVIGPGCGSSEATREKVVAVLAACPRVVLDADALSSFAGMRERISGLVGPDCVLTPHEGEFERLFPGLLASATNRIDAARAASKACGGVVVLKGPDTVTAAPDGSAYVNTNAPPDLATAGSGDVLAGIIGGLLARGIGGFQAAVTGVWWHGACGRIAGPGLIAEDLPDLLPVAAKRLET
jgi:NAD(P)H-hydrate epimerase